MRHFTCFGNNIGHTNLGSHMQFQVIKSNGSCRQWCTWKFLLLEIFPGHGLLSHKQLSYCVHLTLLLITHLLSDNFGNIKAQVNTWMQFLSYVQQMRTLSPVENSSCLFVVGRNINYKENWEKWITENVLLLSVPNIPFHFLSLFLQTLLSSNQEYFSWSS